MAREIASIVAEPTRVESVAFDALDKRFPDRQMLVGFEGGAVYVAEAEGEFVLITSESALADFLDEEDQDLVAAAGAYFFDSDADRRLYASERGWNPRRR